MSLNGFGGFVLGLASNFFMLKHANSASSDLYVGVKEAMNWMDAEEYCNTNYGTHLATIRSESENVLVREAATLAGIGINNMLWIGLNDISSEGNFVFSDGSSVTWSKWASNTPDNWQDNENCVHLRGNTFNDEWNDLECQGTGYTIYFVCNAPITYTNTKGCEEIDGGGWELVRHVHSEENGFHPARDHLLGTDIYGTYDGNAQSTSSWSIDFSSNNFNQFMFAFGDCTDYIILSKDSAIGEYYESDERCILTSSYSLYPYRADLLNREYSSADPFLSTQGDTICRESGCTLYAEGEYGGNGQREYYLKGMRNHGGANVWIRNKKNEKRTCCNYDSSKGVCQAEDGIGLIKFGETITNSLSYIGFGWIDYLVPCNNDFESNDLFPIKVSAFHDICTDSENDVCITEVIVYITDGIETVGISFPNDGSEPVFKNSVRNNGSPASGSYTLGGKYYVQVSERYFDIWWNLSDGSGETGMVHLFYQNSYLHIKVADCVLDYVCGQCKNQAYYL